MLTGFSSLVALASGVSDGIQKLGSALSLSLSLLVGPALDPGRASSAGGKRVELPYLGRHPAPKDPHSLASLLPLTWAVPRGCLGREGVEGPAYDGCLLLQEAPHLVLGRSPLQLFLLLPPGPPLLLVGLWTARKKWTVHLPVGCESAGGSSHFTGG